MPNFFHNYPYTDFHELNLDWVIENMKTLISEYQKVDVLESDINDLRDYVNDYFNNLDISDEVQGIIDRMMTDGTFEQLFDETLFPSDYSAIDKLLNSQTVKIGFLGDSITYGAVIADDSQSSNNYPAVVQRLATDFGFDVTSYNYGVSGEPSTSWETQFNRALTDQCDIVSFCFGHNDFRTGLSINNLLSNISSFITACREHHILPVVCSTPPYYGVTTFRTQIGPTLATAIKNICDQRNAIYVPMYEDLQSMFDTGSYNVMTLMTDGVHFIDYTLLAEIWIAYALKPMVANTEGTLKIAWRNSGLKMVNGAVATIEKSNNGRAANLKGNTIYEMYIYSKYPWTAYTTSVDTRLSGMVTWNFHKYDFTRSESTDYCQPTATVVADGFRKKRQIYDGIIPAGLVKISLGAIVQSSQYAAANPLLYLTNFYVEELPYRMGFD